MTTGRDFSHHKTRFCLNMIMKNGHVEATRSMPHPRLRSDLLAMKEAQVWEHDWTDEFLSNIKESALPPH